MKYILFAILTCIGAPLMHAQINSGKNHDNSLYIVTDRKLYITGETVQMKVHKLQGSGNRISPVKSVLYSDITDKYNNPVVQVKSHFNGSTGNVSFQIPDTLSTGTYYIRTFTPSAGNSTETLFSYKKIAVVNPFGDFSMLNKADKDSVRQDNNQFYDGHFKVNFSKLPLSPGRREKVSIEIVIEDENGNPVEGEFSVSVAMKINFPVQDNSEITNEVQENFAFSNIGSGGYFISGTIWDRSSGNPLSNEALSMGIAGKKARCSFTESDENGNFMFRTDVRGKNILVIQPLNTAIKDYVIELYDPFPPQSETFRPGPLHIDSLMSVQIDKSIISSQVSRIYSETVRTQESEDLTVDFFGQPDRSLLISDYIELASVQEVIRELVPGVMVIKKDGKDSFRIINKYPTGQFTTSPLVILDGIPVYDISQILAIRPAELERIDFINTRYYYGTLLFEGIINIVSKETDLKLYEFPEDVFRQEHEFIQDYHKLPNPDYSLDQDKNSRIPDKRNTLFWNPDVRTDKNGYSKLEFFTGDESGDYEITIDGFSSEGVHIIGSALLKVSP